MVKEKLLIAYGAEKHLYQKGEMIFGQGEIARFYYQIYQGEVKMRNITRTGKEFIQHIFSADRSFGEPPLFSRFIYPADAIAISRSSIWRLPATKFKLLLKEWPEVHYKITSAIAERLYYMAIMGQEISFEKPCHRIIRLLQYLKHDVYKRSEPFAYEVELTRQQIADLTGLRVETAIRAIKELKIAGQIQIVKRKIRI